MPDVEPRPLTRPGFFIWVHAIPTELNPIRATVRASSTKFHTWNRATDGDCCRSNTAPFQDGKRKAT